MHADSTAASPWNPLSPLGMVIGALEQPAAAMIRGTVLRPFQLGAEVAATWAVTRDIAMAFVVVALLYGIIRSQIGSMLGIDSPSPWLLVPRMAVAVVGIAVSLPMVRGLLTLNNLLCSALQDASPDGVSGLMRPLNAGVTISLVPLVFGFASDLVTILVLLCLAVLACSYLIRAAEIVLLTLLLPLAMALWLVPASAGAYRAVAGHLIVAIFVQTAQEVVLLVLATGLRGTVAGFGLDWLWAFAALALLFRCRGLLSAAVQAAGEWVPAPSRVLAAVAPGTLGSRRALSRLISVADRP